MKTFVSVDAQRRHTLEQSVGARAQSAQLRKNPSDPMADLMAGPAAPSAHSRRNPPGPLQIARSSTGHAREPHVSHRIRPARASTEKKVPTTTPPTRVTLERSISTRSTSLAIGGARVVRATNAHHGTPARFTRSSSDATPTTPFDISPTNVQLSTAATRGRPLRVWRTSPIQIR